jgi:WD40 repeat protein
MLKYFVSLLLCGLSSVAMAEVEVVTTPLLSFPPAELVVGHTDSVRAVAYSPDGSRIVSGSDDNTLKIWDASSGKELATFSGHTDSVWEVAYSPDGSRIVSGSSDKTLKIWDASSGEELATFSGHTDSVLAVAYSSDGSRIVSGSWDKTLKIWDASSGKELATLSGHTDSVYAVSYSPDGSRIVSGSRDNTLKIWDASSGKELATLSGHTDFVWSVAYSPDGSRIVSGSWDKTLKIWDASSGQELATFSGHTNAVYGVAYSPDGSRIVSGSYNRLKIWDASSGKELTTLSGHTSWVVAVAYSPDGSRIVSGNWNNTLKIWDVTSGEVLKTLGYNHNINGIALSPDGKTIVSAGYSDKWLKIWDASSGKQLATLGGHTNYVRGVAYSPDGSRIVSGSNDNTLKIWDASSRKELLTLSGHTDSVRRVAYSPDGSRIVSGSFDNTLKIWDASSGTELATLSGHTEGVRAVAYSPDGNRIVSGSGDKTLKIWDASSGKELITLSGHTDSVWAVAYSPDGSRIVSGSYDKTLKIWDASSGQELATLTGHTWSIYAVAYSPDGSRIVSGSGDATVKIWDANSGQLLSSLEAHTNWISGVAFSPSGHLIYSASYGGRTIKVWPSNIIDNSIGKAIVIAASGAHRANTLFPYTDELAKKMYHTLKQRGFTDKNIIYFNPDFFQDIDGDGKDDKVVDFKLQDPAAELKQAFAQTASLHKNQQFVLYIHGHAKEEQLRISREYWLESGASHDFNSDGVHLQGLLANLAPTVEQVIILDTCYSGSVLDELAAPNRIIMTSSDAKTPSWNTKFANFSETLITQLRRGQTFHSAFQQSEQMIKSNSKLLGDQKPQLDDNGDGFYSVTTEGNLANKWVLGREGQAQDEPEIIDTQTALALSSENLQQDLWVKTSPTFEGIRQVKAVLIPPNSGNYSGEETGLGRSEIKLIYNQAKQRFENTVHYNDFSLAGSWQIIYQAQDTQGTWSETKLAEIQISTPPPPVSIKIRIPRSSYNIGETLSCNLDISASSKTSESYSIYAALVYPPTEGYFITIDENKGFSLPNDILPYRPKLELSGTKTLFPLEMQIRPSMKTGNYQCCGVITNIDVDATDAKNWLAIDCKATVIQ